MTELPDVPDDLDEPLKLESGQVITRELLETIREVNRDYIAALDEGAEPLPPVDGERYVACGVFAPGRAVTELLALAVCHLDDEGNLVVDLLARDTTEAEVAPTLRRYGLSRVTDIKVVDRVVDGPLVQAVHGCLSWLHKPPPPLPVRCRSWRHGITFERILEINDIVHRKWCACWEGGVQVRKLPFDGVLVEELVNEAIRYFDDDDLDAADRYCERAEGAMLRWRR